MISLRMVPVDSMLAADGRCWLCHQDFETDTLYCELAAGSSLTPLDATCLGCSAQLAFGSRQLPPDEPDAG